MTIEGILLDLDNTVYDYKTAHDPALAAALDWLSQRLGHSAEETERAYAASRRHVNKCLHGLAASHSRILYFQGVCEAFGQWPCEIALQAEDLYWETFLPKMQVRRDCIAFLNAMQPRPIAIVTDLTARIQFEKVTRLGLNCHVKAIVTSEEVGHEKPHPDIFVMAAQKLALKPQQLCMIGDSWERDIEGAFSMGIQCFWFCEGQDETLPPLASKSSAVGVAKFAHFSDLIEMVHACG